MAGPLVPVLRGSACPCGFLGLPQPCPGPPGAGLGVWSWRWTAACARARRAPLFPLLSQGEEQSLGWAPDFGASRGGVRAEGGAPIPTPLLTPPDPFSDPHLVPTPTCVTPAPPQAA